MYTKEQQGNAVIHFTINLTSYTLLTRWSTSILKVGIPGGCKVFKEDRLTVLLTNNFLYLKSFITKALEYKVGLNTKYKHVHYSLVMSLCPQLF